MQWYLERCVCVVWFMWNKQGWPDSKIICKARWLWYCSALWLLQIPWRYNIGLKMSFKSAETLPGQVKASRPYLPLLNSAQLTAKRLWFALWQGYSILSVDTGMSAWKWQIDRWCANLPTSRKKNYFSTPKLPRAAAFRRRWHPENVKGFRELIGPKREAYSGSSCLTAAIKSEGLIRRR